MLYFYFDRAEMVWDQFSSGPLEMVASIVITVTVMAIQILFILYPLAVQLKVVLNHGT